VTVAQLPLARSVAPSPPGDRAADPNALLHRPRTNGTDRRAPTMQLNDQGLLVDPELSASPALSLWRAPTDNDPEPARAWRRWGADELERHLVGIERDGELAVVSTEWRTGDGTVVPQVQRITTRLDGTVVVEEQVTIPERFHDLPRIGTVLELVPGLDTVTWYGRGPYETYPDRCRAGWIGRHSHSVEETAFPYLRPQETGGRADVRWFTVTDVDGQGLRIDLDQPRQVSVTRFRAHDLAAATHHEELVPRAEAVVHLDAAHRGLGTASCGPDTAARHLVRPGVHRWAWSLRSVGPGESL